MRMKPKDDGILQSKKFIRSSVDKEREMVCVNVYVVNIWLFELCEGYQTKM